MKYSRNAAVLAVAAALILGSVGNAFASWGGGTGDDAVEVVGEVTLIDTKYWITGNLTALGTEPSQRVLNAVGSSSWQLDFGKNDVYEPVGFGTGPYTIQGKLSQGGEIDVYVVDGTSVGRSEGGPSDGDGGPPSDHPGKGSQGQGKKHGFFGNVTEVTEVSEGNVTVTLVTKKGWTVNVTLTGETRYKVPRETKGWDDLAGFREIFGGDLTALEGRRVAVSAINVEGVPPEFTDEAVRFMVFPERGVRQHAHRTGVVTGFTEGMITIVDVRGAEHEFTLNGNETAYRPKGKGADDIVVEESYVTVVTKGDPKLGPVAKAIVLHEELPEWWTP